MLDRYVPPHAQVRGALRLRLRCTGEANISDLVGLDRLPIYLAGDEQVTSSHLTSLGGLIRLDWMLLMAKAELISLTRVLETANPIPDMQVCRGKDILPMRCSITDIVADLIRTIKRYQIRVPR